MSARLGARVLITRRSEQAGSLERALHDHGLEAVVVPAIEIEIDPPGGALDAAVRAISGFDWAVVTSPNGADATLGAAARLGLALDGPSWSAVGDVTAAVLAGGGIQPVFRPTRPDGSALGDELPIARSSSVVLLRGELAGGGLVDRLRARGADVTEIVAYRTITAPHASRAILREAWSSGPPDAVILASGSAARGLRELARAERVDLGRLPAICIGPRTAREAGACGFPVAAIAAAPDSAALAATTAAALSHALETP